MRIIIELNNPIGGYWDGGLKSMFEFEPEPVLYPKKNIIRWGSWAANYWFECKKGKTDKLSVKYALQCLKKSLKKMDIKKISIE